MSIDYIFYYHYLKEVHSLLILGLMTVLKILKSVLIPTSKKGYEIIKEIWGNWTCFDVTIGFYLNLIFLRLIFFPEI
jgi:hypothetical protein